MRVAVMGDGGWGTALAILLAGNGYPVTLWGAFGDYAAYLEKKRENTRFLPGIPIPKEIEITADLEQAVFHKDLIILAAPSEYLRGVLRRLKKIKGIRRSIFLSVTKGIEVGSLKRMSQVIQEELGRIRVAVLSGPTIA